MTTLRVLQRLLFCVRSIVLPAELLTESAWELLLELFVAGAEGHSLTGAEISRRSNIPASALSRWLTHLFRCGLVVGTLSFLWPYLVRG